MNNMNSAQSRLYLLISYWIELHVVGVLTLLTLSVT